MNSNDPLFSFKLQGQTAASAVIATTAITYNSDGSWDFTDAAGDKIHYVGNSPIANLLLQLCFTGTGGFPAGTKLFGFD